MPIEPPCTVGGATSEGAPGVGRRDGSHGQVSRKDGQVNSRRRAAEVTSRGDGDGTGRGTEETFQIIVSAFSRPRWRARSVVARVGSSERRTAQRGDHQPREHFGSEFQLVQA